MALARQTHSLLPIVIGLPNSGKVFLTLVSTACPLTGENLRFVRRQDVILRKLLVLVSAVADPQVACVNLFMDIILIIAV